MKAPIKPVFLLTIFVILLSGCAQKKTGLSEESFLGEWYTVKGDVEAYSFLKDEDSYIFVGTQGMRPVVYGTWKIDKSRFIIRMDNGITYGYSFTLSNDTLSFNNGAEIYTRTEPADVKYPEIKILTSLAADFNDLKFSSPQPAELNWGVWNDSTHTAREFSVNGYSVSVGSTLHSGVIKRISDFFTDFGFEPDTAYVSEVCDGFWDNNQLITISTTQDYEGANDSVYIQVSSALIVK